MIYWAFFIISLFIGGYNYLLDEAKAHTQADNNSLINYVDKSRLALTTWRNTNTGVSAEVTFNELSFPQGLALIKREDTRFFVDTRGIYIAIQNSPPGAANALAKEFSAPTGIAAHRRIGYYHVGLKGTNGCLTPVFGYVDAAVPQGNCSRLLPASINTGSLVITDEDV